MHSSIFNRRGLSPRVRGNRRNKIDNRHRFRSIPACAGEPLEGCQGALGARSIPACAGEPPRVFAVWTLTAVYPRVCGGTAAGSGRPAMLNGLSPRVRGNLLTVSISDLYERSIPACAGEPVLRSVSAIPSKVYPRVCGGTPATSAPGNDRRGLSPRVRGNPMNSNLCVAVHRSIPACAGEPQMPAARPRAAGVYPRVCGGTKGPTRGRLHFHGSIPACAGEPTNRQSRISESSVYPRVCGGTITFWPV